MTIKHAHFEPQLLAEIFGSSNVGLIRHDNQDSFMIANLETGDIATMSAPTLVSVHTAPFILIVADGVGGPRELDRNRDDTERDASMVAQGPQANRGVD